MSDGNGVLEIVDTAEAGIVVLDADLSTINSGTCLNQEYECNTVAQPEHGSEPFLQQKTVRSPPHPLYRLPPTYRHITHPAVHRTSSHPQTVLAPPRHEPCRPQTVHSPTHPAPHATSTNRPGSCTVDRPSLLPPPTQPSTPSSLRHLTHPAALAAYYPQIPRPAHAERSATRRRRPRGNPRTHPPFEKLNEHPTLEGFLGKRRRHGMLPHVFWNLLLGKNFVKNSAILQSPRCFLVSWWHSMTDIQLGSTALKASCTESNETDKNDMFGALPLSLPLSHHPGGRGPRRTRAGVYNCMQSTEFLTAAHASSAVRGFFCLLIPPPASETQGLLVVCVAFLLAVKHPCCL